MTTFSKLTVESLKEALDDFGDHLEVVFITDTGDEIFVYDEIDIDAGTHEGDFVLTIDVGQGRKI